MTTISDERLEELEDKIDVLDKKIDRVIEAISGDSFGMNGGLVDEVKQLKNRVQILETQRNKLQYMIAGACITGGVGLVKIVEVIQAIWK